MLEINCGSNVDLFIHDNFYIDNLGKQRSKTYLALPEENAPPKTPHRTLTPSGDGVAKMTLSRREDGAPFEEIFRFWGQFSDFREAEMQTWLTWESRGKAGREEAARSKAPWEICFLFRAND